MTSAQTDIGYITLQRPCKSIEDSDYQEIEHEVKLLHSVIKMGKERYGVRFDIGHPHRFWEYGRALHFVYEYHSKNVLGKSFLDIGSGYGPLGMSAAILGCDVLEIDPDKTINRNVGGYMDNYGLGKWEHQSIGMQEIEVGKTFDVVCCISVMEHIPRHIELQCWALLASLVKKGGCLFITVDYMDRPELPHVFDNLRETNYGTKELYQRATILHDNGMKVFPLYSNYCGHMVHDYTFFSLAAFKE